MDKKRLTLVIVLVLIILSVLVVMIINKDTIFKHEVIVSYPDGCIEKYEYGVLVSDPCASDDLPYTGDNLWNSQVITNLG